MQFVFACHFDDHRPVLPLIENSAYNNLRAVTGKGTVRFEGPARELLERGDLARAVFFGAEGG